MREGQRREAGSGRVPLGWRLSETVAAAAFCVPFGALRGPNRGRQRVARARQAALYLAHVAIGGALTSVGRHFGRDRTTVRHACMRIEDRRDDPAFDLALIHLEFAMQRWLARYGGGAR